MRRITDLHIFTEGRILQCLCEDSEELGVLEEGGKEGLDLLALDDEKME